MARCLVVQAFFDLRLQMLCPETHTERFTFQPQAAVHQHSKCIPCRVPYGQHQCLTGQEAGSSLHPFQAAIPLHQTGKRGVEMDLAAQRLDLRADGGNDPPQHVCAHMGLLLPGDLLGRTVLQKHLRNKTAQLIPDAGGELAPSEKVPAPPSPNWILALGSSWPVAEKCSTACTRCSSAGPRSSTMGRYPWRASSSAANSPAGPNPQTTGRQRRGLPPGCRVSSTGRCSTAPGVFAAYAGSAAGSRRVTATV